MMNFTGQLPLSYSNVKYYIHIARPDHWFKNLFVLPGFALAVVLGDVGLIENLPALFVALVSVCLIASANYVINEWLDAEFDKHHPIKQHRPSAVGHIKAHWVYFEYVLLAVIGLAIAATLTWEFFWISVLLLVMGIIYNVRPFRSKETAFLDVLTESVNNPIRLLLGWSAVVSVHLPPSSIMIAYWMGGAFLMAMKRYAEFRFIDDPERAGLYRASFRNYTEASLLLSTFFYALTAAFFLGIFLIKYRIEFILSFPLFALLFTWYLAIGIKPVSASQTPEKLYKEKAFVGYVVFLCAVITALFFIDIPALNVLMEPIRY